MKYFVAIFCFMSAIYAGYRNLSILQRVNVGIGPKTETECIKYKEFLEWSKRGYLNKDCQNYIEKLIENFEHPENTKIDMHSLQTKTNKRKHHINQEVSDNPSKKVKLPARQLAVTKNLKKKHH